MSSKCRRIKSCRITFVSVFFLCCLLCCCEVDQQGKIKQVTKCWLPLLDDKCSSFSKFFSFWYQKYENSVWRRTQIKKNFRLDTSMIIIYSTPFDVVRFVFAFCTRLELLCWNFFFSLIIVACSHQSHQLPCESGLLKWIRASVHWFFSFRLEIERSTSFCDGFVVVVRAGSEHKKSGVSESALWTLIYWKHAFRS